MTPNTAKHSVAKPTAMPFGNDDPKRQQRLLIAGIGGAALVVAIALLFIFRPWQSHHPALRLDDDPGKIARVAASDDFTKLPFERRQTYMKMMDSKKAQIVQAHANGQISDEEYQKALMAAHLGKQLSEYSKYIVKPMGPERIAYLDKIINKKETKDEARKNNAADKQEKKEEDMWRNSTAEAAEIATWPADVRRSFTEFRDALTERKKLFKELHPKPKKSTTKSSTAPTTKPTD